MPKAQMGRVNPRFPFYLDPQGMPYIKLLNLTDTIYQGFNWLQSGSKMQLRTLDKQHSTKAVSKAIYTEKEVDEFQIDDNHHLSTEPLYQELRKM